MKKILLGFVILSIFLIMGAGCQQAQEPVDTTPVEDTTVTTPEKSIGDSAEEARNALEGKICESRADCGERIQMGEPYCIGDSSYRYAYEPRCTYDDEGVNFVCKFKQISEVIGDCTE